VNTRDELLTHILDAVARIKKCEDQLRQKTHDLRTRAAKCIEVEDGIFEHKLSTVTICVKIVINNYIKSKIKFTASNLSLFIAIHNPSVFVGSNSYFSVTSIRRIFI
jgi:hypothetical protein